MGWMLNGRRETQALCTPARMPVLREEFRSILGFPSGRRKLGNILTALPVIPEAFLENLLALGDFAIQLNTLSLRCES